MQTKERPSKRAAAKPVLKRHQVNLDDSSWAWLEALPGGASKGLQTLIGMAREQGVDLEAISFAVPTGDVTEPAAVDAPAEVVASTEADLAAVAQAEAVTVSVPVETTPVATVSGIDPETYVASKSFHVAGAKVYDAPLSGTVNKRQAHMARVVYEPAHHDPKVGGAWGGRGRTYATWVFSEEPGLTERLLKSGLELVMDTTLEPKASVGYHQHVRTEELYYLLSGSLTVATRGADGVVVTETLHVGDAHLVRPGQGHTCMAGDDGARYLTVAARI